MVTIGLKGRTHDWLEEETFLFLNLDQWKPFYFYFLTIILKKEKKNPCLGCMASQEALRALVLYLGHSLGT